MNNTNSEKRKYACTPKPKIRSYQDFLHEIYGYYRTSGHSEIPEYERTEYIDDLRKEQ